MSRDFNADPTEFDVSRDEENDRYTVSLNDDADSVAYVNHERGVVTVYSDGPEERQKAEVPLDLFKAVAVESDL